MKRNKVGKNTLRAIAKKGSFYNSWLYSLIRPYLGKNILEVGSGIGNISEFLVKDKKIRKLVLSDISSEYLNILKTKFKNNKKVKIVKIDFASVKKIQTGINAIICFNVLEHIKNDRRALLNANRILNSGGRLILLVPAGKFAYGTLDKALGHYRRYSLDELVEKIKNSGFKIIKARYINFFGLWGWWLSSKVLRKKTFPQNQFGVFNRLFKILAPFENKLIENKLNLPCGLSCFVIARK